MSHMLVAILCALIGMSHAGILPLGLDYNCSGLSVPSALPRPSTSTTYPDIHAAIDASSVAVGAEKAVLITMGNNGVRRMLDNLLISVTRIPSPPPVLVVPLEEESARDFATNPYMNLVLGFQQSFSKHQYAPGYSHYGTKGFQHVMSAKMTIAKAVLSHTPATNYLYSDADIVFKKDPFAAIAALPKCDVYFQSEVGYWKAYENGPYQSVFGSTRRHFAFHTSLPLVNNGFFYMRNTASTHKWLDDMMAYADRLVASEGDRCDDQCQTNTVLLNMYLPAGRQTTNSTDLANYVYAENSAGRCATMYARDPAFGPTELAIWIFDPFQFPLWPLYAESPDFPAGHPETMIHFNWMVGTAAKEAAMQASCHMYA